MPFLYSSKWMSALLTLATASARAGTDAVSMFCGSLSFMKKVISVSASSVLPEPLGPKMFRRGKNRALGLIMSRNSVAR